jgi:hypothetical protein
VLVLEEDVERHRLRAGRDRRGRADADHHPIAGAQRRTGLGRGGAVDQDVALVDQALDLGAGQLGDAGGDEDVEPAGGVGDQDVLVRYQIFDLT